MKVQILQLDPHDDLASARDKLAWVQAQRVLLVWPERARILRKRLDLVLLRRQASRQGVELGIVTRDPVVLEHAAELGIPVFRSSTRLPEETWKTGTLPSLGLPARPVPLVSASPPPPARPRSLPGWLRILIVLVVALVLAFSGAALLPSATITVSPETRDQESVVTFTLDPQAEAPTADGRIPARQVSRQPSGSTRVTTTGKTLVPGSPASGEVVFTNLTDEIVLVPAGTGILPEGRPEARFTTVADLSLPAGQGASEATRVVAVALGTAGNLPAGSLNAIDGPLGLRTAVSQPDALAGGTETERTAVAAADHATALRVLTERLLSDAASEFEAQLDPGEALASASVRVTNTPQREYDRQVGEAADSVGLTLTLEVSALVYDLRDVDAATALSLEAQLSPGPEPVPGALDWTLISSESTAPEILQVRAHQQVYTPISEADVTRAARGKHPEEAEVLLAAIPGQGEPARLELAPAWWPFVPWLDVRIRVQTPWERP